MPSPSPSPSPSPASFIPLLDLRLLSLPDLRSLAAVSASPGTSDLRRCGPGGGDEDLVVPNIDRSAFNESAASHKQTYFRLRLRRPPPEGSNRRRRRETSLLSGSEVSGDCKGDAFGENEEKEISGRLRRLFAPQTLGESVSPSCDDDDTMKPEEPVETEMAILAPKALGESENPSCNDGAVAPSMMLKQEPEMIQTTILDPKTLDVFENQSCDDKAELPPQEPEVGQTTPLVVAESGDAGLDPEREVLNSNGEMVDLDALGEMGDPFDEELSRRTAGILSEEELVAFMGKFEGKWGNYRKRTRVVDAAEFGNHLPKGWKLLLAIKRKQNDMWVFCRKYISPSGKQFASCKEVSSYVLSLNGQLNIAKPTFVDSDGSICGLIETVADDLADSLTQERNMNEMQTCSHGKASSPCSADHHEQVMKVENASAEEITEVPSCRNCNMNFSNKDAYKQHQCSYHQSTKRRKHGTQLVDGVIIRDGKFECQFCHKSFTERHRYVGHVGSHVKRKVQTDDAVSDRTASRKKSYVTLAPVPYIVSSIPFPAEQIENLVVKSADKPHTSPTPTVDKKIHSIGFDLEYRKPDATDFTYLMKVDNDDSFDITIDSYMNIVESSNVTSEEPCAPLDTLGSTDFNIVTQEDFGNKSADAQYSRSCMTNCIVKDNIECTSVQYAKPGVCQDKFLHPNNLKQETVLEASNAIDNSYLNMTYILNMDLAKISNNPASGMCQASSMSTSIGENNANPDGVVSELEADVNDAFGMETTSCFESISMSLYSSNNFENDSENNAPAFAAAKDVKGYGGEHISQDGKAYVPMGSCSETNFLSSESFLDRGTVINSTKFGTSNSDIIDSPFNNGNANGIWTSAGSMLDFDFVSKDSILEATDRPGNRLDNCLDMNEVGCDKLDASDSAQHNYGRYVLHNMDIPSADSQRHENYFDFQQQTDASESSEYVGLNVQGPIAELEPPAESCFMAGFQNTEHLSQKREWGPSSRTNLVCVWCDSQFSQEVTGGTECSSLGFLCPTCKTKISGFIDDIGKG